MKMAKRRKVLHFRSKEDYRRWLAYGHIRTKSGARARRVGEALFAATPGHVSVYIRGKKHRVVHGRRRKRR